MLLHHGPNCIQECLGRALDTELSAGMIPDAFSTCPNLLDLLFALLNDRKSINRFTASQQWTPDW